MSSTLGVLRLDFDPWLQVGPWLVRLEAVALALGILVSLLLLRSALARTVGTVRTEDAVFILLAAIPGAVVGGRLVHGLEFLPAYAAQPGALLDLGRGSLSLVGAVAGGVLSAAYVCRLLGQLPGRWLDAAAVPLLVAIGFGKLAMLTGGAGQGIADAGALATYYAGAGWVSADPTTPSLPAQAFEGLWTLLGAILLLALTRSAAERWPGTGRRFLAAISWWLTGRLLIGFTWRDDRVIGPLSVEQLATALVLLAAVATLPLVGAVRARRGVVPTAVAPPAAS